MAAVARCPRWATTIPGLSNVAQLALADSHTCALLTDGRVACFGEDTSGQSGLADSPIIEVKWPRPVDVPVATIVAGLSGVVEISAGAAHTCARLSDRTVRCFGATGLELIGRGVPVPIEGIADVAQLASGRWHTCARHVDGTVTCWGSNSNGQLARDLSYRGYAGPQKVASVANAVEIAAGTYHTCVRHVDGRVTCWGSNAAGESGGAAYWVAAADGGPPG